MRFECDSCSTRYSIPDARVTGRVLKIRCKRCQEVVEVIGPPSPDAPGGFEPALRMASEQSTKIERHDDLAGVSQELEHRASGLYLPAQISDVRRLRTNSASGLHGGLEAAEWWAGVQGSPQGPLRRSELLVMAQRGEITERSYLWRPSMKAWRRVGEDAKLRFVLDAIRARKSRIERPRQLGGMESGIFVNTGLFDASLLASALSERTHEVDPHKSREPSGLTRALKQITRAHSKSSTPARPLLGAHAQVPASATTREPTIQLGGSDWFALSEHQQVELWSHALPPDLPGITALVTGVHLLPKRRRLKALLSAVLVLAAFVAGILMLAWLTRDGLAFALQPQASLATEPGQPYKPDQNLVAKIRQLLDPDRGKGVRWPGLAQPEAAKAQPARRARRVAKVRVVASAQPTVSLDDAVRAPVSDPSVLRSARPEALQIDASGRLRVPTRSMPILDLGVPVAGVAPSLAQSDDLDAMDVARVVEQRRPQLETCYTAALKRDSNLRGSANVSIIIDIRGHVRRVSIPTPGPGAKGLAACMSKRMRRWRFHPPSTELEVVMPLRLNPVQ